MSEEIEPEAQREPWVLPLKDEAELKKIALDAINNLIFIPRNQNELQDSFGIVFLFSNMTPEEAEQIGLVFEYYSEAGPMAVNGLPSFFSAQFLHKDDVDLFWNYIDKYKDALDSV